MATGQMSKVIQYLRSTACTQQTAEPTDGQLLECFIKEHESAALEAIVRRHASMVWGVCKRILCNHHDAEDAFQAAFLVLVRRASSIKPREMVGNWLYGVAQQTALKARATRAKRQAREKQGIDVAEPAIAPPEFADDVCRLLDQEMARLPDKYRCVLILCELEGKSLKDTAQQLGLPPGTIASRLARGRTMLANRLARHGPAVSGVSLAALLSQQATSASVPATVLSSVVNAVMLTATGQTVGGILSANALNLAEGVVKAMLLAKLGKLTAIVLLTLACAGLGYVTHLNIAAGQPTSPTVTAENQVIAGEEKKKDVPAEKKGKEEAVEKKDKTEPAKNKEKAKRKPGFTVGKATTLVEGPLDKDGYIDYETALNQRLREGVTPQNNAAVLLFKAFGPNPGDAKLPDTFFKWLQVVAPSENENYFVNLHQFMKNRLKPDPAKQMDKFYEDWTKAAAHPWQAKDNKVLADWLKLNEKPLAIAIEASKRTHYYYPLLSRRKDGKSAGLISASVGGVQECQEVAHALAARAMLSVSEKRYDDAWQDLLACHRLGRLVGHGGTMIEGLVGIAIDRIASSADLGFLDGANRDAKQLKKCLRDLQALPSMPTMAEKLNLTERYWFLEVMMFVDRDGIAHLDSMEGLRPGKQDPLVQMVAKLAFSDVQWDTALSDANQFYDRLAAAMRLEDRGKREEKLLQIEMGLKKLKTGLLDVQELGKRLWIARSVAEAKGKYLGDTMLCLFTPVVGKVQHAWDKSEQTYANLQLAFALAAYKSDEGRYPLKLDALAPKYLTSIPQDLFSGKALIYRPTENGYLLYSVGVNGRDDGGRDFDDNPPGDDLPLRMPRTAPRQK